MSSKVHENDLYGTSFSIESIKVIAESIGIANLQDEAAKEMSDEISFRLKHIIQDAAKFMHHAKRIKLMPNDVDSALRSKNLEVHLIYLYENVYNEIFFSPNLVLTIQTLRHSGLLLEEAENCIFWKKQKLI